MPMHALELKQHNPMRDTRGGLVGAGTRKEELGNLDYRSENFSLRNARSFCFFLPSSFPPPFIFHFNPLFQPPSPSHRMRETGKHQQQNGRSHSMRYLHVVFLLYSLELKPHNAMARNRDTLAELVGAWLRTWGNTFQANFPCATRSFSSLLLVVSI